MIKRTFFLILCFNFCGNIIGQTKVHQSAGIEGLYVNSIVNTLNYKARINLFEDGHSSIGLQASPGLGIETFTETNKFQPAYTIPLAMEYIHGLTSDENNLSMSGFGARILLLTTNGGVNPEDEFDLTSNFNAGLGLSYIFQNDQLQTAAIDLNGFVPVESSENIIYEWGVSLGLRFMFGIY